LALIEVFRAEFTSSFAADILTVPEKFIIHSLTHRHPDDGLHPKLLNFSALCPPIKQPAETYRFCGPICENLVGRRQVFYEMHRQLSRTTY